MHIFAPNFSEYNANIPQVPTSGEWPDWANLNAPHQEIVAQQIYTSSPNLQSGLNDELSAHVLFPRLSMENYKKGSTLMLICC